MSFLKAEWRKLAIINYEVEPDLLTSYVPHKTEIDLWDNTCYVSLVGFMFVNTKLLGVPIPFHRNFEEVNLRFYVRYNDHGIWKRGVVFIKEIVPKSALTFVANTFYKEHYVTHKMKHCWKQKDGGVEVSYQWRVGSNWQSIRVQASDQKSPIITGSETEFITEHYWGYTRINDDTTYEYEVTHPAWEAYDVRSYEVDVDYSKVYGQNFGILNEVSPKSAMLAEGSMITVESKKRI